MKLLDLIVSMIIILCKVKAFDEPPKILSAFSDTYYIPEDNKKAAEWQCNADGNPRPEYEWKLDGNTIRSSQYVTVDKVTGRLAILGSQIRDFGGYQCFAKNRVGTALSAAFKLERTFIAQFSDTGSKTLETVNQYRNVSLKCSGKPRCVPWNKCKIEWKKGEGVKYSVSESRRIAIDKEGTLHFLYVLVEDASSQTLPYSCVIGNEDLKAYHKGPNFIMPVAYVETPTRYRPMLLFKQDTYGFSGGQAELQCVFNSYPVPDITWERPDGTRIKPTPGKYEFDDNLIRRNLIIKQLSDEDEGEYTCTGTNGQGSESSRLFLNVTSKPFFKKGEALHSLVKSRGRDATFTCKMYSMKGERLPSAPEWYRNGQKLPETQIGPDPSQKYELSADRSVLTIKKVQKSRDSSAIMCKAGNVIFDSNGDYMYSERYAEATLRIIDPININDLSNLKKELTSTEPFSLTITATTDESVPQLYYKWKLTLDDNKTVYDQQVLQTLPFVKFNADKTNLTILPKLVDESGDYNKIRAVAGIYKVVIYHDHDSVTKMFYVHTNVSQIPIVSSAGFELWIIGVILGVIVLCIFIAFIVCTLYRNRGEKYIVDKNELAEGHDSNKRTPRQSSH